jgi:hypothetical protein
MTTSWGEVPFLASSDPCDSDTWSDGARPEWTTATSGKTVAEVDVSRLYSDLILRSPLQFLHLHDHLQTQTASTKKDTTAVVTEESKPESELATRKYLWLLLTWKPEPYRTKAGDLLLTCIGVGDCNKLDPDAAACFRPMLLSVSLFSDIH